LPIFREMKYIVPHCPHLVKGGTAAQSGAYFCVPADLYSNATWAVSEKDVPPITPLMMDLPF
jgi:hypothetical protein